MFDVNANVAGQPECGEPSDDAGQPRWLALLLGLGYYFVLTPLLHGVLPWAVSLVTARHGWSGGHPGTANLVGILGVVTGVVGLLWIVVTGLRHWDQMPRRVKLGLTPPYLLMDGPYAHTRNPIFLSVLAIWLGWAVFYGSPAVLAGLMILGVGVNIAVPREERTLERHFGEVYVRYKATVPRWLGFTRQ
jgi:protein-S-isoprenylcysteine O-methyltransferase Ste14